jgi:hypothetical protein
MKLQVDQDNSEQLWSDKLGAYSSIFLSDHNKVEAVESTTHLRITIHSNLSCQPIFPQQASTK